MSIAGKRTVVDHMRQLAQQDPDLRSELAAALQDLADEQEAAGDLAAALVSVREAGAIRRQLLAADPYAYLVLAGTFNAEANWLADAGRITESEPVFQSEAAVYREMAQRFPVQSVIAVLLQVSDLNVAAGRFRSAESAALVLLSIGEDAVAHDPDAAIFVAGMWTSLARIRAGTGRTELALDAARSAVELGRKAEKRMPSQDSRAVLATALRLTSELAGERGLATEAQAAASELTDRGLDEG